MNGDRSTRLAVAFARGLSRIPSTTWCGVCEEVLQVSGAGITIMGTEAGGPLCVSNATVAALEDVQFIAGEGPCPEAFRTGISVHLPRLDAGASLRWPSFTALALDYGVSSVFSYPLVLDGAKVGVLSLYHDVGGSLTPDQDANSLAMAEILTETVLSLQDTAPAGDLAEEIGDVITYRAEIYQASGIVAVQLGLTASDALSRIRAYAFARDQSVDSVASAIVNGRLRLDGDEKGTQR